MAGSMKALAVEARVQLLGVIDCWMIATASVESEQNRSEKLILTGSELARSVEICIWNALSIPGIHILEQNWVRLGWTRNLHLATGRVVPRIVHHILLIGVVLVAKEKWQHSLVGPFGQAVVVGPVVVVVSVASVVDGKVGGRRATHHPASRVHDLVVSEGKPYSHRATDI